MDQHDMTTIDKATHGFYCLSIRFCDTVNTKKVSPENAEEWLALLMELYVSAMRPPAMEPDDDLASREKDTPPQLVIQCHSTYWEVFDPFELEEPVCGDLRDDLQDIYADLRIGIREYEAGRENNALWEWKFGVDNHWGQHAVDAIRALHSIRVNK